jgi:hypothetical protein
MRELPMGLFVRYAHYAATQLLLCWLACQPPPSTLNTKI